MNITLNKFRYFLVSLIVTLYLPLLQPLNVQPVAITTPITQHEFVIVVPSYNNKEWYTRNLDSIFSQDYSKFSVVYLDDASTDGTGNLVRNYLAEKKPSQKVTVISNTINVGGLANIYTAVHEHCDDRAIVVELDGDDWFAHNNVLKLLNNVYSNPQVWFTYGQYQEWPTRKPSWVRPHSAENIRNNYYRHNMGWIAPLRSFYAWLFKKVKKEDLLDTSGNFLRTSWDHAMMWPICEMAAGRFAFISHVLYIYNKANPIADSQKRQTEQFNTVDMLCAKERYTPLIAAPDFTTVDSNKKDTYEKDTTIL